MRFIIVVAQIFFFSISWSQKQCDIVFQGQVRDFHDNSILANAKIFAKELNKTVVSNAEGRFVFENLCKQPLTLSISHFDCDTKTIVVNIEKNISKIIRLEHHLEQLGEIAIEGNSTRKETKTAQETVLKSETLVKYSSLSLGDALREVSGVTSINTGNAIVKPIINGMHSSRILILNNGVRLQDQEWGIEHAPNIDINTADQISVIKGASALAYGGDAIGGAVVIKLRKPILQDTLFGKTIVGGQTNGRGYFINSSINKNYESGWFAKLQASYKRNGDFEAADYNLTNTGLESKGLSARFGKNTFESGFEVFYNYVDNEVGILRSAHVGNAFDLERAINSGQPFRIEDFSYDINVPKQDVRHHLAKATYYKRFSNFGKLSLQYDYQYNQRFEFDVRIGDRRNTPAVDLTLQTHSILADVNLDANLDRKINLGIMGRYQNNFADPDTGVRRLIPDYDKYDFGIYATTEWRLNENIIADGGIRYDFNRIDAKKFYRKSRWEERGYQEDFSDIIIDETGTQFLTNPVFNYHNISGALGAKFDITNHHKVIFNYNLASRSPNPSELFSDGVHQALARFELGDLRFNQEVANRVSFSYHYNTSKFNLLTEVFYNNIRDYIYLRPFDFIRTNRGPYPIWAYEQTNAELFGLDISATYSIFKNLEFQNKTAFIKGNDLNTNLPLIHMPPFNTRNQITYSNPKWHNFSVSLQSDWEFEQNEFPNFNFEIEDLLTGERKEVDISTPPPAYHLIHFYSKATFPLGNKTDLNISLAVNNMFDTSYRNYLNQLRLFADDLGRNIILQLQLNY